MLQLHHEMQINLNQKHNISTMDAVINFTFICKENLQAACGVQESATQSRTRVIASTHEGWQIYGGHHATLEIEVFDSL